MKDHIVKESGNAGRHYATITEVFDFGPHISRIILDTECELAGGASAITETNDVTRNFFFIFSSMLNQFSAKAASQI